MENEIKELKCYCCKTSYTESDKFCGNCGYPLQGTPEEQKKFSVNYTLNHFAKEDAKARVKEARIVLFVISAFTVLSAIMLYAKEEIAILLVINLIIAALYAGLGFWAKYRAFPAILTGGLIYVSIILLSAFLDPLTIFRGIILKILFIGAFIKASYGAYKYKV
jgi:hypothetical protein